MLPDLIWKSIKNEAYLKKYKKKKYIKLRINLKILKINYRKVKNKFSKFFTSYVTALIGYLGYETIEQFEKIPERKSSDLILPDGFFIRPSIMAIFDSLKKSTNNYYTLLV